MIKKFKEFINENIRDILKGKSEDDIEKEFKYLDNFEIAVAVYKYDLPKKYLPKNYDGIIRDICRDIKDYVKDYGGNLTMGELESSSSPCYKYDENEHMQHLIERLYEDEVEIVAYEIGSSFIKYEYTVPYEKLNIEILIEIRDILSNAIESGWVDHKKVEDLNENIRDFLKPISKEKIKDIIKNLSDFDRIYNIDKYNLPKEYLPKNSKLIVINRIKEILIDRKDNTQHLNLSLKYVIDTNKEDVIKYATLDGLIAERKIGIFYRKYKISYEKLDVKALLSIVTTLNPSGIVEIPSNLIHLILKN